MRSDDARRRLAIVVIFALALPPFVGGFLARPYIDFINWTGSMVRPHMAHVVFVLEGIAIALLLLGCALVLGDKARRRSRTGVIIALGVAAMVIGAGLRIDYARRLILPPPPLRDWHASFSPYGKWKSDLGFTIDIPRNGTYQVCDGALCASGKYTEDHKELVLVNFRNLAASQRIKTDTDAMLPCEDRFCGTPTARYNWRNDMYFRDSVPNYAHQAQCGGDRECVLLGQFKNWDGMFYKIGRY